jgi:hypothetical protein
MRGRFRADKPLRELLAQRLMSGNRKTGCNPLRDIAETLGLKANIR